MAVFFIEVARDVMSGIMASWRALFLTKPEEITKNSSTNLEEMRILFRDA
jgi:hypothetical protein